MSITLKDAQDMLLKGAKLGDVYPNLTEPEDQTLLRQWYVNHPTLPVTVTPRGQWNGDEYGIAKPSIDAPLAGTYLNGMAHEAALKPTPRMTSNSENDGVNRQEPAAESRPIPSPTPRPGQFPPEGYRGEGGKVRRPPQPSALQAKSMGYTGDCCTKCGSVRMVVSGACAKCEDCGEQGGCG